MTRVKQGAGQPEDFTNALAADSRERAVTALLRVPTLRKLWTAHLTGAIGDRLGLLALLALAVQAAVAHQVFGDGYRGVGFAIAAVFGLRLLGAVLFGAFLLGPLSVLTSPQGVLDRRWTMIGSDVVRLALFVVAPLWVDWAPDSALAWLLVTVFITAVAERLWNIAKDGAAPALLPAQSADGVRPGPDHLAALRRLDLRTGFVALPIAAAVLVCAALLNNVFGVWSLWFQLHHVALASYVAAGLFAASVAVLYFLELPGVVTPHPRSPLEGLRRPLGPAGSERGRTAALPTLVLSCAAVAGSLAAAVSVAVLHAIDLGGGPVGFGMLVLALTGGIVVGIRTASRVLPLFSRRRLMGLAIGVTGLALLLVGLVPDPATVLLLALIAGYAAGVAANTGHTLIDQETEDSRRARTTNHLHAVVRTAAGLCAVAAPVLAAVIGPHRVVDGAFTFDHGGAAFTLMLVGALLLPVAALVLGKLDDRAGVPLGRDLREAVRGAEPAVAPAATGFFLAVEGGDGAGKSTQVQALAEWIRGKGHEVVVTREPGATAVGKRLRAILLDVSGSGVSHRAEALLYAADRAEHVGTVIRPALERGAVVISDRYIDSSVAYQGAGRDLAPTEIARISRWATDGLVPHLTLLLDLSPRTARERFTEAPDRLESEPPEFHDRVRRGFLALASADPLRYLVIDGDQEAEAVTRQARERLDQVLPLSAQEVEARAEAERRATEEARERAEEARRKVEAEAAAKAERERLEREKQERVARLQAEEEERLRLAAEQRRREETERQAEETRLRAEEERRLAEEERVRREADEHARAERERGRREAEERARAEEQARLRRLKEEQDRLRAEAEARRLEKQRRAEEALLRAERVRGEARPATEPTPEGSVEPGPTDTPDGTGHGDEATRTVEAPRPEEPEGFERSDRQDRGRSDEPTDRRPDDETRTVETPHPPAEETRTIEVPRVQDAEETTVLPRAQDPAADETTVLPRVRPSGPEGPGGSEGGRGSGAPERPEDSQGPGAATGSRRSAEPEGLQDPWGSRSPEQPEQPDDRTALLPPVRDGGPTASGAAPADAASGAAPADRVPPWLFREDDSAGASPSGPSADERTRELPQVPPQQSPTPEAGRRRPRPSWAEETPLDDLPSLADELLGPHDDSYDSYESGSRGRRAPGDAGEPRGSGDARDAGAIPDAGDSRGSGRSRGSAGSGDDDQGRPGSRWRRR